MTMDGDGEDSDSKRVLKIQPSLKEFENSSDSEEIWFDGDDLAQASRIDWGLSAPNNENSSDSRVEIGGRSILIRSSILDSEKICDLSSLPGNETNTKFGFGWGLELSRIVGGLRPRQVLWIQTNSYQPVASDWMAQLVEGLAAFRQHTQWLKSETEDASPSLLWITTKGFDAELWLCKYLARWTQTDWRMLLGGKTAAQAFHLWTEAEIKSSLDRCRKWENGYTNHIGSSLQVATSDSNSLLQLDEHIIRWLQRYESSSIPAIIAFPDAVISLIRNNDEAKQIFTNLLLKIRQRNAISMIDSSSLISIEQAQIGMQRGDILLKLSEKQDGVTLAETTMNSEAKEIVVNAQICGQGDLTAGICKFRWTPKFGRMLPWEA